MRRFSSASAKRFMAHVTKASVNTLISSTTKFQPVLQTNIRSASSLSKLISNEITMEKSQESHLLVDQTLEEVQTKVLSVFKLHETPGNTTVTITREYNDERIEVSFDIQDTADAMDDQIVDLENADNVTPGAVMIPIEIKIIKGDDTLIIDATASDYLDIIRVSHEDPEVADMPDKWLGPDFQFLGDDLQEAFFNLLEERQIDKDLCFFILAYTYKKENREYLHWLDKMKQFTAGN
mmetsp:Transcript_11728/g.23682  ORF Transcript_11728/g.23682 Transcript_11728/m.23682 type:complete len:237 (-) Transcript_11728:146-856(-)